jgi:hypothetical protein
MLVSATDMSAIDSPCKLVHIADVSPLDLLEVFVGLGDSYRILFAKFSVRQHIWSVVQHRYFLILSVSTENVVLVQSQSWSLIRGFLSEKCWRKSSSKNCCSATRICSEG